VNLGDVPCTRLKAHTWRLLAHGVALCQVWVYSGRGSGEVWMKVDKGQGQGAGQEVSPAGVGDRLDSMTKVNEC